MSTCEVITQTTAEREGLCLLIPGVPRGNLGDMQYTLEVAGISNAKYVSTGEEWFEQFDVYIPPLVIFDEVQAIVKSGLLEHPRELEVILVDGNPPEDETVTDQDRMPPDGEESSPYHWTATKLPTRRDGQPFMVDAYVLDDTGLGYLVEHPRPGEAPTYIYGPGGFGHAPMDQDHYRPIHIALMSPIIEVLCFSEQFVRRLVEVWSTATDWNRPCEAFATEYTLMGSLKQMLDRLAEEEECH